MKIDIHRHSEDKGSADVVMRNLFHYEADQVKPKRYYSAGLHPWHVKEESLDEDLRMLRNLLSNPGVIAVGEAGLDKTIEAPVTLQMEAFRRQVALAVEFSKPMIIHCVRAYNEVYQLHQESDYDKPWIIHWYNASPEMADQLVSKNFYLSFGHMIFNDRSKAFKSFTSVPRNKLFFETDDSAYSIDQVYNQACFLRSEHPGELEQQIADNFHTCFGIRL